MRYMKRTLGLFLIIFVLGGPAISASGFLGFGGSVKWEEEVLLHDGRKIIVERSQALGGYPTIESRERKTLKEEWVIPVPGTGQKISWKTGFRNPPQGPSLMLVLVDFIGGTPYIATSPAGCIAYNYWDRPNPPYVFFRYDDKEWQRIPLSEFPVELKEVNVVVGRPDPPHRSGLLSIATIKEENRNLEPHLRRIIREPLDPKGIACKEMIRAQNGWFGIDWFSSQPNYESCLKMCDRQKVDQQNCPCDRIFNKNNRGE